MKFALKTIAVTLFASLALAAADSKQVVVSYPNDTPQSVVEEAMNAIKIAGGIITHEYHLIKGFAATASEDALNTIHALGNQMNAVVEEDKTYYANGA